MNSSLGTITAFVKLDTSGLLKGLTGAKVALGEFGGQLKQAGAGVSQLAQDMGRGMTLAAAGLAGGLALATKQAAAFDQAMRNVNSIAKVGETQFQGLKKSVLSLTDDPRIRQAPVDLAKGLYDVVSSGFSGQKALDVLRVSAVGASAGMTDTATSSRVLMAVLNSGIGGVDSIRHAMDILFREVDLGVNTFEGLAGALGDVLPTAKVAGVSLQEVSAALVVMTRRGINVNEAVTALNQLLNHVLKPGKDAKELMDALGISYGSAAIQAQGLTGWLQQVVNKTHGNTDELTRLIPEVRGMKALLTLTDEGARQYTESLKGMQSATQGAGSTQRAVNEQMKGAEFQAAKLKQEMEKLAIEIGETLLPSEVKLTRATRDLFQWFARLPDPIKASATNVALFGSASILAVAGVVRLTGAIKGLWTAVAGFLGSTAGKLLINGPMALLSGTVTGLYKSATESGYLQQFGRGMGTFGTPVLGAPLATNMGANIAPLGQPPAVFQPFGVGINPLAFGPPQNADALAASAARKGFRATGGGVPLLGAEARRAAAARTAQERLDLKIQDALGFGWYDPDQVLAMYQGWQKTGASEQMGRGLAAFAQAFVASVASVVVSSMTGRASTLMGGAVSGMGGALGNAMQTSRNLQAAAFLGSWRQTPQAALGAFGGAMGVPVTATAAAQGQVLEWMQNAFGAGGPMWDQAKPAKAMKRGFEFVPDLAYNLADEFARSFGKGLEKAFGGGIFGKALSRTLENQLTDLLGGALSGLFPAGGAAGLGKSIGGWFKGIGKIFGFAEGGWVPGPPGAPQPAIVHGGEYVVSRAQLAAGGGGGLVVHFHGDNHFSSDYDVDRMIDRISWRTKMRQAVNPG